METMVCPDCGDEYFSHVTECAECGVGLVSAEEIKVAETEKEDFLEDAGGEVVALREGDGKWIKELHRVLKKDGIKSFVSLSPDCKPGACKQICLIFVARDKAELAEESIQKHAKSINPDLGEMEKVDEDVCPACGHHTGKDALECSDCGLSLAV